MADEDDTFESLPKNRNDKENNRFGLDGDGKVGIRTIGGLKTIGGKEIVIDIDNNALINDKKVLATLVGIYDLMLKIDNKLEVIIDG